MADVITTSGGFTYYSGDYDLSVALNAFSLSREKGITPEQALAQINPAAAASGLYRFDGVTGRPVAPTTYQTSRFQTPAEASDPNSVFFTGGQTQTPVDPVVTAPETVEEPAQDKITEEDPPEIEDPFEQARLDAEERYNQDVDTSGLNGLNIPPSVTTNTSRYAQSIIANPLLNYESYTYCISLHLLTETQFNNFIANPQGPVPQRTIVASAGRYINRDPNFAEDFYFDDFRMTTIINTTKRNRSTNLIECHFTVVEPMGFTLINRLLDAVAGIGGKNYIRQPYLLQIDFFGYRDGTAANGAPIPNLTKYIPISLISLKSRVSTRGTEYSIDAVPFNHQAFNTMNVASPAAFTVKASTVQELMGTGNPQPTAPSGQYQVLGFAEGLNAYYKDLVDRKEIFFQNEYRVEFHPSIGNAKIFPTNSPNNLASAASGGTSPTDQKNNIKAQAGQAVGQINFNSGVFNIPAGTKIDQLIDYAVRNSDYIKDQLADPTGYTAKENFGQLQTKLGNPLRWFRIIPKIKIKPNSYDPARQQYAYEITYYVKPWTVNSKHPYAPQGRTPGFVKEYNYIFTGKNKDIIDLQLDFDMLYYTQIVSYRNKGRLNETGDTAGQKNLRGEIYDFGDAPTDLPPPGQNAQVTVTDRIQPVARGYVSGDAGKTTRTGAQQSLAVTAGDVQKDITLDAKGDMINIKMRIFGDPTFIKQDDIFYSQDVVDMKSTVTPNGSLITDGGELYVYVNFESPADYSEFYGQAIPGLNKYRYSEFSGIYKIITVESTFRGGKFEQSLDLVRLPIQDQLRNQVTNAYSRLDTYVNQQLGQLPVAASRFSGPNILVTQLTAGSSGILNAALTGGSVAGAASSFGGQLVNAATNFAMGKINEGIQKGVNAVVSKGTDFIKDQFKDVIGGGSIADIAKDFDASALLGEFGIENLTSGFNISNLPSFDVDLAGSFDLNSLDTDLLSSVGINELMVGDLGDLGDLANLGDVGDISGFFGSFF